MKIAFLQVLIFSLIVSCNNRSIKEEESTTTVKTNSDTTSDLNLTLEDFGKYMFGCVQRNDYLMYSKYIPSKVELVELLKKSNDVEKSTAKDQEIENGYKQTLADIKKGFDQTVSEGVSRGIIWSEANYIKTSYNSSNENGFEFSKIIVSFSYKGLTYSLEFRENVKSSRGWLTISKIIFEDKLENIQPAEDTSAPVQNN